MLDDVRHAYWNEIPYISLDTETTGFRSDDRIVEIAILLMQNGEVLDSFHTKVNPRRPIPEEAQAVHGISDADVQGAPPFDDIRPRVLDFLRRDVPWVAHNMSFDARMLSYDIPRTEWPRGVPTLCTLKYAQTCFGGRRGHKLFEVANRLGVDADPSVAHSAYGDAELLGRMVPVLMDGRTVGGSFTKMSHQWGA